MTYCQIKFISKITSIPFFSHFNLFQRNIGNMAEIQKPNPNPCGFLDRGDASKMFLVWLVTEFQIVEMDLCFLYKPIHIINLALLRNKILECVSTMLRKITWYRNGRNWIKIEQGFSSSIPMPKWNLFRKWNGIWKWSFTAWLFCLLLSAFLLCRL